MFQPDRFVNALADLRLAATFNPYSESRPPHDRPDAAARRRRNLRAYLHALTERRPEVAWVGRDLGYRGGRRTGLPLTDEPHLERFRDVYGTAPLRKATRTPAPAERTAAVVWELLPRFTPPPLLWNVFPLHPHEPGRPLTNRAHSAREAEAGLRFLLELLDAFQPHAIHALGAAAHEALSRHGVRSVRVRHPSHGGAGEFRLTVAAMQHR